jgi:hypothetical protein
LKPRDLANSALAPNYFKYKMFFRIALPGIPDSQP